MIKGEQVLNTFFGIFPKTFLIGCHLILYAANEGYIKQRDMKVYNYI